MTQHKKGKMEIRQIDKAHYRKQVNLVTVGFVALFAISSLAFGSLLIALFGNTEIIPDESTGNLQWNIIGVVLGLVTTLSLLNQCKHKAFMADVLYVWQLKQLHNKIYSKQAALEKALAGNDPQAILIMAFYYTTQKQVFLLDNNTLTLSSVEQKRVRIEEQAESLNMVLNLAEFEEEMLSKY